MSDKDDENGGLEIKAAFVHRIYVLNFAIDALHAGQLA
jgi:hypothetical protein